MGVCYTLNGPVGESCVLGPLLGHANQEAGSHGSEALSELRPGSCWRVLVVVSGVYLW